MPNRLFIWKMSTNTSGVSMRCAASAWTYRRARWWSSSGRPAPANRPCSVHQPPGSDNSGKIIVDGIL